MLANRRQEVGAPTALHMPRWTHITINCSNLERSIDFYTNLCGLTLVRDRRLEGRHNVWLGPPTKSGEDPLFALVIVQDEIKFRLDHFGFQCVSREEVEVIQAKFDFVLDDHQSEE